MRQLSMLRPDLEDLPAPCLPDRFWFRDGAISDAEALASLLGRAYPEMTWTPGKSIEELLGNEDVSLTVLIDSEEGLAATASLKRVEDARAGYVHYVACDPAFAGRGLGKLATLMVLHAARAAGKEFAVLDTDDFRLFAIKPYLALGFIPVHLDEGHAKRWSRVFEAVFAKRSP